MTRTEKQTCTRKIDIEEQKTLKKVSRLFTIPVARAWSFKVKMKVSSTLVPVADTIAHLQPFLKPGSTPSTKTKNKRNLKLKKLLRS